MKSKWLSLFSILPALLALEPAFASYDCSITALKRGEIDGVPTPDFYPYNRPTAGARVFSFEGMGMSGGTIGGEEFIVESKKSDISFFSYFSYSNESQEAEIRFSRNSKPNRHGVKTEHTELGKVEIKGTQAKVVYLDGGLYKVSVICAIRDSE